MKPSWDEVYKKAERLSRPDDLKTITGILKTKQREGCTPTTGTVWLDNLRRAAKHIDKPLNKITAADIEKLLNATQNQSAHTREKLYITTRWLLRNQGKNKLLKLIPSTVKDISKETIPFDKLPTRSEIPELLTHCDRPRDRAIIATLFDTGVRVGELLSLYVGDVDLDAPVPTLRIREGKTGQRLVPIIPYHDGQPPFCPGELDTWINKHPTGEGALWTTSNNKHTTIEHAPIEYRAIQSMLYRLSDKCKRKEKLTPHLFRHACATERAHQLTDSEMEAFFGWTPGSNMRARYVKAAGVRAGLLTRAQQIAGVTNNQQPQQPQRCPICTAYTPQDARFCPRCGAPTRGDVIMKRIKAYLNEMKDDPEKMKEVIKELFSDL